MSPWEAAVQFEGRVDPAFQHIPAYQAAAAHITLDDFVDDEDDGQNAHGSVAAPSAEPPVRLFIYLCVSFSGGVLACPSLTCQQCVFKRYRRDERF